MAFFTKSEARTAASVGRQTQRGAGKTFDRILKEEATAARDNDEFDIFLSHSINDAELILGVKALLERQGFKVYVDWVDDPQLNRQTVSKETAQLLRQRMRQSKSLIYVATDNASSSKWMPWELGFFDGFKPGCLALMPVMDNENQIFKGQEYLSLYPIVQKDHYSDGKPDIFVEERGVRWSTLKRFGSGQPIWAGYTRNT